MKRLAIACLSLSLFLAQPILAHDWSGVVQKVYESTGMLTTEDGDGFCAAWSIDNRRDFAMTAAHCVRPAYVEDGVYLDGIRAELVYYNAETENDELDVAVIHVPGMDRPELKPRTKLIRVGMEAGSLGFGLEDGLWSHFRAGNVAGIGSVQGLKGIFIILDQALIGGMSGGPILDTDGRVFALNQMSDRTRTGLGKDIGTLYRATAQYWRQ